MPDPDNYSHPTAAELAADEAEWAARVARQGARRLNAQAPITAAAFNLPVPPANPELSTC